MIDSKAKKFQFINLLGTFEFNVNHENFFSSGVCCPTVRRDEDPVALLRLLPRARGPPLHLL